VESVNYTFSHRIHFDRQPRAVGSDADPHVIAIGNPACEDLFRQLVRDFLLKQALERACTERRIVTSIGEPVSSLVREMQMEVVGILGNTLDSCELDVHNSANLLLAERPEHDDLVDAVQELRTQALLEQPEDLLSDVLQRRRIDVT